MTNHTTFSTLSNSIFCTLTRTALKTELHLTTFAKNIEAAASIFVCGRGP